MKIIYCLSALALVIILSYNFTGCSNSTTDSKSSTVENIAFAINNDTLSINIDVENTKSNATRNAVTSFATDSVIISLQVTDHSSGTGSFYLIGGMIQPDTTFRTTLDSITSSPRIFKARSIRGSNSFSLALSDYTGKAKILVTDN